MCRASRKYHWVWIETDCRASAEADPLSRFPITFAFLRPIIFVVFAIILWCVIRTRMTDNACSSSSGRNSQRTEFGGRCETGLIKGEASRAGNTFFIEIFRAKSGATRQILHRRIVAVQPPQPTGPQITFSCRAGHGDNGFTGILRPLGEFSAATTLAPEKCRLKSSFRASSRAMAKASSLLASAFADLIKPSCPLRWRLLGTKPAPVP